MTSEVAHGSVCMTAQIGAHSTLMHTDKHVHMHTYTRVHPHTHNWHDLLEDSV